MSGHEQLQPPTDLPAVAHLPGAESILGSYQPSRAEGNDLSRVASKLHGAEDLGGLIHELSQPLGAISNYTAVCLHYLSTDHHEKEAQVMESVRRISEQANRANEIIRRLKSLVLRQESELSVVDVDDPIQGVEH